MLWLLVVALGLLAGALTTVTGIGGGMLLVVVLAVVIDPVTALSSTAMGLLVGNAHRIWLYRRELSGGTALPVILGAVPGAIVAGLVLVWLPSWLILGLMVGMGTLALVRVVGPAWTVPAWAGFPVGVLTGVVTASSGGGGLIVAPWVLTRGLAGGAYVGTIALIAFCMHLARIAAYGAGGATDLLAIELGLALAVTLPLGNLVGHVVRERLAPGVERGFQLAVIGIALVAAGIGLGRDLIEPGDDFPPSAVAGDQAPRPAPR